METQKAFKISLISSAIFLFIEFTIRYATSKFPDLMTFQNGGEIILSSLIIFLIAYIGMEWC
ncbi:MAG: hypothetical protein AABY22_00540 [Nanoarchaeota archaeon]